MARAGALGIPQSSGERFPCVLPGHGAHEAWLRPLHGGNGIWEYFCPACAHAFSLPAVRGILAYGPILQAEHAATSDPKDPWLFIKPPGEIEVSRWGDRLDYDTGLRPEPQSWPVVPEDLSANGKAVARGIGLVLGLRPELWDEKFTFARCFCRAYCGLTDHQARAGTTELRRRGVITLIGQVPCASGYWTNEYRLAQPLAKLKAEKSALIRRSAEDQEALIARFIVEFDAVELPRE